MASLGQTSTQEPHRLQVVKSSLNSSTDFFFSPAFLVPSTTMHSLGHARTHRPQAVQSDLPVSGSRASLMWPRKRVGIFRVWCGYWTVMVGLTASPSVMRMPTSRLLKPPSVSRKAVMMLMGLKESMQHQRQFHHQAGQQEGDERERNENFPGEVEKHVELRAGKSPADPDDGEDERIHLGQEPPGAPEAAREDTDGALPAAQKQDGGEAAADDDVRVFGHEKDAEAHAAVFGEGTGDEFALGLGHVEGRAVGLGQHADEKDDERHRHERIDPDLEDIPVPEPAGLLADDLVEIEGAGHHQHGDNDKEHRNLVGDALGNDAGGGDDGELVARGPAAEHEGHDVDRAEGKDEEEADVEVARDEVFAERDRCEAEQRRGHDQERRDAEEQPVGAGRHNHLLREELEAVGDWLEPAAPAGLVGAGATLEAAGALALGEHEVGGVGADERANADDVEQQADGLEREVTNGGGAISDRRRGCTCRGSPAWPEHRAKSCLCSL